MSNTIKVLVFNGNESPRWIKAHELTPGVYQASLGTDEDDDPEPPYAPEPYSASLTPEQRDRIAFELGVRAVLTVSRIELLPMNDTGVARVMAEYDAGNGYGEMHQGVSLGAFTPEEGAKIRAKLEEPLGVLREPGETDDGLRERLKAKTPAHWETTLRGAYVPYPPEYTKPDGMYGRSNWGESVIARVSREMRALDMYAKPPQAIFMNPDDNTDDRPTLPTIEQPSTDSPEYRKALAAFTPSRIVRSFFKCCTPGCPDRAPIEGTAAQPVPTCYTCGKPMRDLP